MPWVVLSIAAAAAGQPEPDPASTLPSLNRILRRFDFEEAEQAPFTMPLKFYRYIAPDQGYPPFGTMELTDEVAHDGHWSFRFELDGGSLSARVPTAVLPVLPGSDYAVSAWIRTEGLTNSAAQLSARLHDMDGRPIFESGVSCPPIRTGGRWQRVWVMVRGDFATAADMVLELEVLQSRQLVGSEHPGDEPLVDDITGRAWFDDVTVWHRPRMGLSIGAAGSVIRGSPPTLDVTIRDRTPQHLSARLRIYDVDGVVLRDDQWPLPTGSWTGAISPAAPGPGWFRAVLDVSGDGEIVGRQTLDFAVLPDTQGRDPNPRFGVILPPLPSEDTETVRRLADLLEPGGALVPVSTIGTRDDVAEFRDAVESLLARGTEVTLALSDSASNAALRRPAETSDGLEALGFGAERRRELREPLMDFGLRVHRWHLGIPGTLEIVPASQLADLIDTAQRRLSNFSPDPTILIPWSAQYELSGVRAPHGHWIEVPYEIPPESLAAYAARWSDDGRPLHVTLERLPADGYSPGERIADLVIRALHGWRAGLERLVITAPWSEPGPRGVVTPDAAYPVWREIGHRLKGRAFAGTLWISGDVKCWILNGPDKDDTTLAAWIEHPRADDATMARLLLADGPVEVVDVFGNRRTVPITDGAHEVPIGLRPVFIEGADARLAKFRSEFAIEPSFVEARQQVHERRVRLTNPWQVAITGTVRLWPPAGWRITPRIHPFNLAPGQSVELPISVTFNRGTLTGPATVEAEVELTADRDYRFRVIEELEVGLDNIAFSAHWRAVPGEDGATRDLIVTQHITNTGNRPVSLSAYVSGPGISRQRRPIASLEPNLTAVRTFHIPDGARLLAGTQLRVGVTEQGGTVRLNRVLDIPARLDPESIAGHNAE